MRNLAPLAHLVRPASVALLIGTAVQVAGGAAASAPTPNTTTRVDGTTRITVVDTAYPLGAAERRAILEEKLASANATLRQATAPAAAVRGVAASSPGTPTPVGGPARRPSYTRNRVVPRIDRVRTAQLRQVLSNAQAEAAVAWPVTNTGAASPFPRSGYRDVYVAPSKVAYLGVRCAGRPDGTILVTETYRLTGGLFTHYARPLPGDTTSKPVFTHVNGGVHDFAQSWVGDPGLRDWAPGTVYAAMLLPYDTTTSAHPRWNASMRDWELPGDRGATTRAMCQSQARATRAG